MLKKIRLAAAGAILAGISLLFAGALESFAPLAAIQIVPAILAGSAITVAAIAIVTLVFGRVYCSVVCPLGLLQDVISRFGKKGRFRFARNRSWLRVAAFCVFVAALIAGMPIVFGLLEPYSAFGRIASELAAPALASGLSLLSVPFEYMGLYFAAPTPVWAKGVAATISALATFLVVGFLAFKGGRTWCNTVCPIGALLGLLARYSLLKPWLAPHKCVGCGRCESVCKASCIDVESRTIDASRCIACFNCLDACHKGAIVYSSFLSAKPSAVTNPPNLSRRSFLGAAAGVVGLPVAMTLTANETEAAAQLRLKPESGAVPTVPPGAVKLQRYRERCTSCQLCVASCPSKILGSYDHGSGMLQPALSFKRGYCWEDCVVCSKACPTSAIRPITVAEKNSTQIGLAVLSKKLCINTREVKCKVCEQNCPRDAIKMVNEPDGTKMVAVNPDRCTGCGACEYLCPVRPRAAITVQGHTEHREISGGTSISSTHEAGA